MNLSGNNKNKITGKKYQPVMSITGLNDQGLKFKLKTNLILKFQDKALAKIASFKTVVLTKIDKPEQILIVQQNLLQPTKICFW